MIKSKGLEKSAQAIANLIRNTARCTIDGETVEMPITKYTDNNKLIIHVTFDNSVSGLITKIELIDVDGDVYGEQIENTQKPTGKMLLSVFEVTITEAIN